MARNKKQKTEKAKSKASNKDKIKVVKPKLWNLSISLTNCLLHTQNENDAISYANSVLKTYFPNADIKINASIVGETTIV